MSAAVVEAIDTTIAQLEKQIKEWQVVRTAIVKNFGVVESEPAVAIEAPELEPDPAPEVEQEPPADPAQGMPSKRTRILPAVVEKAIVEHLEKVGAAGVQNLADATGFDDYRIRSAINRLLDDKKIKLVRTEGRAKIYGLTETLEAAGAATDDEVEREPATDEQVDAIKEAVKSSAPPAPAPTMPKQPSLDKLKADVFAIVRKEEPISPYVIHGKLTARPHDINTVLEQLHQEGRIYRDQVSRWCLEEDEK